MLWVGGKSTVQPVKAQERTAAATAAARVPVDELQRSNRIDSYHLVARDGAERGETLYYYKCWMCHNQYTVKAQYADQAPFLHLN